MFAVHNEHSLLYAFPSICQGLFSKKAKFFHALHRAALDGKGPGAEAPGLSDYVAQQQPSLQQQLLPQPQLLLQQQLLPQPQLPQPQLPQPQPQPQLPQQLQLLPLLPQPVPPQQNRMMIRMMIQTQLEPLLFHIVHTSCEM